MKSLALILAFIVGNLTSATANELIVSRSQPATPDAALSAFITSFRAAITAKKPDYKKINAMFAPKVTAFTRSLDPLQPWFKSNSITADYLNEIVDVIVEQGPPQDGVATPDYRTDALSLMAGMIGAGSNLGKIEEVPGSLCAPAAWSYNVKAMKKFAASNNDQVSSLRFFSTPKAMLAKPKVSAKSVGELPAYVPLSFIYEKTTPENWGKFVSANGLTGFLKDDTEQLGFSQMHICFGKVSGKYKVTSIFGYGL
jgi:hypothetical protein